jgi:hypothetical protein
MKLKRLLEMIREDGKGAEEWPVFMVFLRQNSAGEWHEAEVAHREPVTSITSEELKQEPGEVLLITDSDRPPLSLARLEQELSELMPCLSEYTVDGCQTPIVYDGGTFHIDFPIVGTARDKERRCFLVCVTAQL